MKKITHDVYVFIVKFGSLKKNKYQNASKSYVLMKVKQKNHLVMKHLQHLVLYS